MTTFGKIIIGLVSSVALLGVVYVCVFIYMFSGMCGSYPYKTVVSPNGKHKAVIYQFDCGATTGFSTQISILSAESNLTDEPGNIFRSDGHPEESAPEMKWLDDQNLNIYKKENIRVYSQEESWGWFWNRIRITYN